MLHVYIFTLEGWGTWQCYFGSFKDDFGSPSCRTAPTKHVSAVSKAPDRKFSLFNLRLSSRLRIASKADRSASWGDSLSVYSGVQTVLKSGSL